MPQPLSVPTIQKPTPIVLDQLLIETEDSNGAPFDRMLEVGHMHADQIRYPGHKLLKQGANSYGFFQRTWGNDFTSQDSYNVAKKYEEDSISFPTFIRSYRVLRDDYLVTGKAAGVVGTRGAPFTGVVSILVASGGTNYTKDFAISSSGGSGSGLAGIAIVNRGAVIRVEINNVGTGYNAAPAISFASGDGTGASASAVIQPTTAVLISEEHAKLPEDDPYASLWDRVTRVYAVLPGYIITNVLRSEQFRGRDVTETIQKGLVGTLPPETGNLIISSETQQISSVVEQRTTRKFASLPPTEVWAFWGEVSIPTLIFDITQTVYCNNSSQASIIQNFSELGGNTVIRKHRKTVSYVSTAPNTTPDLSASSFTTTDLTYKGKWLDINKSNVLNDALSYTVDIYKSDDMGACFWTEAYSFSATTPSATSFLAGIWLTRSFEPEPLGDTMFKITKIEYYSAEGNPTIV